MKWWVAAKRSTHHFFVDVAEELGFGPRWRKVARHRALPGTTPVSKQAQDHHRLVMESVERQRERWSTVLALLGDE